MITIRTFKEYDKLYADQRGKLQPWEVSLSLEDIEHQARNVIEWPNSYWLPTTWTREYIEHAVYTSCDAQEWQKFRVSLKGQSTRAKIYRLVNYYMKARGKFSNNTQTRMYCRIYNYLGALKRAGVLDSDLKVIR